MLFLSTFCDLDLWFLEGKSGFTQQELFHFLFRIRENFKGLIYDVWRDLLYFQIFSRLFAALLISGVIDVPVRYVCCQKITETGTENL